jgi:hypothetical protein
LLSSDGELLLSLLLLLLLLLDWGASSCSSVLLLWSLAEAFLLSLVFLVMVILEGDECVRLSLLCLEELEDEEAVVSELAMCLELSMDCSCNVLLVSPCPCSSAAPPSPTLG